MPIAIFDTILFVNQDRSFIVPQVSRSVIHDTHAKAYVLQAIRQYICARAVKRATAWH